MIRRRSTSMTVGALLVVAASWLTGCTGTPERATEPVASERLLGVAHPAARRPHARSSTRGWQARVRTTGAQGSAPSRGPSGPPCDDRRVLDRLRGSRGMGRWPVHGIGSLLHAADPSARSPRPGRADDRAPRTRYRFGASGAVHDRRAIPRGTAPVHRGRIDPLPRDGHRRRRRTSDAAFRLVHASSIGRRMADLVVRGAEPRPQPSRPAREGEEGRRRTGPRRYGDVLHLGDRERCSPRRVTRGDARRLAPHRRREPREGRDLDPRDPEGFLRTDPRYRNPKDQRSAPAWTGPHGEDRRAVDRCRRSTGTS